MAHEYTLSTFLKQTPKPLLKAYFDGRGVLGSVDFKGLGKRDCEPIIAAMDAMEDAVRTSIEQDFQDMFLLADKVGTQIILDETGLAGLDVADEIESMENHYQRAMWLFLNHRTNGASIFESCMRFAHMKELSFTNAKRRKDLPTKEPKYDDATRVGMADALRAVYKKQGRGHRCVVEHAFRPNPTRHCFFAYPEDYTTSELQYDGDDLRRRCRKSVFQVVFVFRPDEGVLEISAPGQKKDIEALQEVFCRYALEMDRLPPRTNDRCYELNGLKRLDFDFPTKTEDQIEKVEVVALRMNVVGNHRRRVTVEQDPNSGETLHAWMKTAINEQRTPLRMLDVTSTRLKVTWRTAPGEKAKTLTFSLTAPDSTSLKDLPQHNVIKRYLKPWKLAH